jgi:hypothetical protein
VTLEELAVQQHPCAVPACHRPKEQPKSEKQYPPHIGGAGLIARLSQGTQNFLSLFDVKKNDATKHGHTEAKSANAQFAEQIEEPTE